MVLLKFDTSNQKVVIIHPLKFEYMTYVCVKYWAFWCNYKNISKFILKNNPEHTSPTIMDSRYGLET